MVAAGDGDLRRGETGDGDPVGGAGDVVEADFSAESDRGRVAAMLAADAHFQVGAHAPTLLNRHLDQLAHAVTVQCLEWVLRQNLVLHVLEQEFAFRVIA